MNGYYSLSKFRCISCLIVAIVMVCTILVAQEKEAADTITVTATGIGHNTDEALKDAFKNAVRRAVGVYVLTETTMNSNEEIDEKVYANADATINSHTVIDTKTLPNNLVNVTIKAEVLKGVIGQKIDKAKTTEVNKTDIVNVTNHLDAMEEALKSLDLLFKDFPAYLFTVEAIGQPVIDQSKDLTPDIIPMLQEVRISINYQKYQQMINKLTTLFDRLGYKKGKKIILTDENCKAFTKENFNNCLWIITRKNPNIRPMKLQDMNGLIYRLPGQIMRNLGKYTGRKIIFQYELSDIDNNVISNCEKYNQPYTLFLGCGVQLDWLDNLQAFHPYWRTWYNGIRIVKDEYEKKPLTALLYPLFDRIWSEENASFWRGEAFVDYVHLKIMIQVNRQLYEKSQKLKINVSIQNKEDDNLVIP